MLKRKGFKHTEETKQKISKKLKGIKRLPRSAEHRKKLSLALKGKKTHPCLEKTKRKISKAKKGKKHSEETKRKIGKANTGNTYHLGKKHSEETKRKMSLSRIGRKHSEATKKKMRIASQKLGRQLPPLHRGKNCHFWKGGISFEKYRLKFTKKLKEIIRNRDKRICRICKKTELKNKKKLSVHHIDYNKKNNKKDNLISLYVNCHVSTNFNRKQWKQVCGVTVINSMI